MTRRREKHNKERKLEGQSCTRALGLKRRQWSIESKRLMHISWSIRHEVLSGPQDSTRRCQPSKKRSRQVAICKTSILDPGRQMQSRAWWKRIRLRTARSNQEILLLICHKSPKWIKLWDQWSSSKARNWVLTSSELQTLALHHTGRELSRKMAFWIYINQSNHENRVQDRQRFLPGKMLKQEMNRPFQ